MMHMNLMNRYSSKWLTVGARATARVSTLPRHKPGGASIA
jgi:hypothetical protein